MNRPLIFLISACGAIFFFIACHQPSSTSSNPNLTESDSVVNNANADAKQIKIGNQLWATANLSVTHFSNGDLIPEANSSAQWEKAGVEGKPAWCYYNQDPVLGKKYGMLFNWYAVTDKRNIAPRGWHIPDDDEWKILTEFLGEEDAGTKMKSPVEWKEEGSGANKNGFNGLPGGYRYNNGNFNGLYAYGSFWSNTSFDSSGAWYRYLGESTKKLTRNYSDKRDGFSVRCIRD